jgi:hypothetical protein
VAVGDGILTSADAANWEQRLPGPMNRLFGVAYGNGRFVAAGDNGTILISTNAQNWESLQLQGYTLNAICYGNGLFVAVSTFWSSNQFVGALFTSTDATNWVQRDPGTTKGLGGVAYGNGLFVAVGDDIVTSSDGATWIPRLSRTNFVDLVAYGNGQFVAMDVWGSALTSSNGLDWAQQQTGYLFSAVTYGTGLFVAVGYGNIVTSTDGVTWVQQRWPSTDWMFGIAYGGGQFVAVGEHGTIVSSADGLSWHLRQAGAYSLRALTFGDDQFVAVGSMVSTSTNAVDWVPQSGRYSGCCLGDIAYGQGRFVAFGDSYGYGYAVSFVTSSSGVIWGQYNGPPLPPAVTYGGGQFVAIGYTSTDGVNWDWTGGIQPTTNSLFAITYANRQFVAVGDSGTIITSVDATNWVQHQSGTTIRLNGITSGNGLFVAVGGDQPYTMTNYQLTESIILTSTNGVDWVQRNPGTTNVLSAVAYGSGQFVAVGTFGTLLTSTDGIKWTVRQSGTQNDLRGVSYGKGHFVTVGDNGTILESGSIVTLTLSPSVGTSGLTLSLTGPTGLAYAIEESTDLVSWRSLTNVVSTQPTNVIFDALPATSKHVFYRATSQ